MVSWFDSTGTDGNEYYSAAEPRWQAKLDSLSYPTTRTNSSAWVQTYFGTTGQSMFIHFGDYNSVDLTYKRVKLACDMDGAGQPWHVLRWYFKFKRSDPFANSSVIYTDLALNLYHIQPGNNTSSEEGTVLLQPALTTGEQRFERIRTLDPIYSYHELEFDRTGLEYWLTIPQGDDGTYIYLPMDVDDELVFKAQGGGVTPDESTNASREGSMVQKYTSNTPGTSGALHVALRNRTADNQPGDLQVCSAPMVKFDVKPRQNLKITIQPIALRKNGVNYSPWPLPEEEELEAYLNSVFGKQVNVYTDVTVRAEVPVAYDVGLGLFNSTWGYADDKLSVFQGQYSDAKKGVFSAEENLILQAEGAAPDEDPDVGITLYWVAANGGDKFSWPYEHAAKEAAEEAKWLTQSPFLGYAGKAMKSSRQDTPSVRRVIWMVGGRASSSSNDPGYNPYTGASAAFVCAHELGHALGDLSHTLEKYGQMPGGNNTGFSDYSDNLLRLMTGITGHRRDSEPKQLSKTERDLITTFPDYVH